MVAAAQRLARLSLEEDDAGSSGTFGDGVTSEFALSKLLSRH